MAIFTGSRVPDILSVKLGSNNVRGAAEVRYILAIDEIKTLPFLVGDLIDQKKDKKKALDACEHCLLKTLNSFKGLLLILRNARLA